MRIHKSERTVLIASATIFVLAACSAGSSQLGLPNGSQTPTALLGGGGSVEAPLKACPKARVYVANFGSNAVSVYPQRGESPAPCATITTGIYAPASVSVDSKGTLYVANYGNENVTEYLRNADVPSVTFNVGLRPEYIFVGADGTVYISAYPENEVLEFAPGASSVTRTISIPYPFGMVTDNKNNLYVAYNGSDGKGHVEKFKPQATTGKDLGITVGYAYDIKLTKKSDLVLGDAAAGVVNIYPRGKTTPSRSFPTVTPFSFALNRVETRLYVATSIPGQGVAVSIYDFQTGALLGAITNGTQSPDGVALDPTAPYAK
ncbi:MAG: hypothetical protein WBE30_03885 [Candidatus Cybelea sp.]|jgi:DNA-binding beta-propeller fold protein YncE